MTTVLTWNIQCGVGVDGRCDLDRIAATCCRDHPPDVVCLQEVARHWPEIDGGAGADQVGALADRFPGYEATYGVAVDRRGRDGRRRQIGNLILTRVPLLETSQHLLPRPPHPGIAHMQRQASEVTVRMARTAVRIVTTHLEYHAPAQRLAQADRLRALHVNACANARTPPAPAPAGSPYEAGPGGCSSILCGDLNALVDDDVHRRVCEPFDDGTPTFVDAWRVRHPQAPHAPTCGIYDRDQWPSGPHCRDFVFITADMESRLREVEVDTETAASDHQPVRAIFADLA